MISSSSSKATEIGTYGGGDGWGGTVITKLNDARCQVCKKQKLCLRMSYDFSSYGPKHYRPATLCQSCMNDLFNSCPNKEPS